MGDFKMTKEQKAFMDSLICQRISDDEANKEVIREFSNPKSSSGITGALKRGWNQDKQDKVAYYIIKDPKDNQPLFFFSLKCGELHLPLDPEKLNKSVTNALMVLQAAATREGRVPIPTSFNPRMRRKLYYMASEALDLAADIQVEDWANELIDKRTVDGELPPKAWNDIWDRVFRSRSKWASYQDDKAVEGENIIRTQKTFAAVELVHFCAHEPARDKWKALNMGKSLGRTMFWYFVEPKIRAIRDLVGCEYIYLFAADQDRNGSLVKLYRDLGFDFRDDLYLTKPAYDFSCFFMCQEVTGLRKLKNEFLKNFNQPKTPAVI